jgi:hypothetical protein
MSPSRANTDPDDLIAEIIIDAYDQDEGLIAFENAYDDEGHLPCPATVIGHKIQLLSVCAPTGRRELIATCQHAGHQHDLALLDIHIHPGQPAHACGPPTTTAGSAQRTTRPEQLLSE